MKLFRTLVLPGSYTVAGCAGTYVNSAPSVANGQARPQTAEPDKASYKKALYVADTNYNVIKILTNRRYRELGAITNGISHPTSLAMDRQSNLYIANSAGADVTEYAPGQTTPKFTYNDNMEEPLAVAVDRHGNVYESDDNGYINQYFQGLNSVSQSCSKLSGGYVSGLAVDASGDVFASYPGLGIYEYTGGLSGCNATLLNDFTSYSLALDSNNDLICTGGFGGGVFVVDPPYTSVTRNIGSSFSDPTDASINQNNKLVFVADYGDKDVKVINYQTGANVKILNATNGITGAGAVVDAPNAVY